MQWGLAYRHFVAARTLILSTPFSRELKTTHSLYMYASFALPFLRKKNVKAIDNYGGEKNYRASQGCLNVYFKLAQSRVVYVCSRRSLRACPWDINFKHGTSVKSSGASVYIFGALHYCIRKLYNCSLNNSFRHQTQDRKLNYRCA